MKNILQSRSRRYGFDGWSLKHRDSAKPWSNAVCTTREEAREIKAQELPEMRRKLQVVKVRVVVEVVS